MSQDHNKHANAVNFVSQLARQGSPKQIVEHIDSMANYFHPYGRAKPS